MDRSDFIIAVVVVFALLMCCSVIGRYYLKRIAVGLALVAAGAVLLLDGRSPL